jgi:ubiquinone/menaquinone biosynthesis C-methylase UbiE
MIEDLRHQNNPVKLPSSSGLAKYGGSEMAINDPGQGASAGTWGSNEAAEEWRRVAAERARFFGPVTERMLDLADIRVGSRVLDIGAGAGDQALAAARRVGPTGLVLATDISANMLETAAISARQEGLSNVDTRVMDAQTLDLPSASFDTAISRFALMLVPDIDEALQQIRRVLRPSGKFAAIVFEKCPYLSIPHAIARRVGQSTSPPEPFGEFRLAGHGVMADAYKNAGFHDVAIHPFSARRQFPSLADAVRYAKETPLPLRELMGRLTPTQHEQAWADVEQVLQQFVGPDGYDSPCDFLIGVGTK